MKCEILHESKGRMRIHALKKRMISAEADKLQYYLLSLDEVCDARVYEQTCDAVILYQGNRGDLIRHLACFSFVHTQVEVPDHTGRELNRTYEEQLVLSVLIHFAKKLFLTLKALFPNTIPNRP